MINGHDDDDDAGETMFQVTVTVPASKLGGLLSMLPRRWTPQIDRLVAKEDRPWGNRYGSGVAKRKVRAKRKKLGNGKDYVPRGLTADLLKALGKQALTPSEMVAKFPAANPHGVRSAHTRLIKFGQIHSVGDGRWEAV